MRGGVTIQPTTIKNKSIFFLKDVVMENTSKEISWVYGFAGLSREVGLLTCDPFQLSSCPFFPFQHDLKFT